MSGFYTEPLGRMGKHPQANAALLALFRFCGLKPIHLQNSQILGQPGRKSLLLQI